MRTAPFSALITISIFSFRAALPAQPADHIPPGGLPLSDPTSTTIIQKDAYLALYDHAALNPRWVCYRLTLADLTGPAPRLNAWTDDPTLPQPHAYLSSYAGTPYDRGHLRPAADTTRNLHQQRETYSLANIIPQTPALNRGQWARAEKTARAATRHTAALWILCGPAYLEEPTPTLPDGPAIPSHCWRLLIAQDATSRTLTAAILEPNAAPVPWTRAAITIDDLEQLTGLNFLAALNDVQEHAIEAASPPAYWLTPHGLTYQPAPIPPRSKSDLEEQFAEMGMRGGFHISDNGADALQEAQDTRKTPFPDPNRSTAEQHPFPFPLNSHPLVTGPK